MDGSLDTFGVSRRVYVPKVRTRVHAVAGKSGPSLDSLPPVEVDSLITSIAISGIDRFFLQSHTQLNSFLGALRLSGHGVRKVGGNRFIYYNSSHPRKLTAKRVSVTPRFPQSFDLALSTLPPCSRFASRFEHPRLTSNFSKCTVVKLRSWDSNLVLDICD